MSLLTVSSDNRSKVPFLIPQMVMCILLACSSASLCQTFNGTQNSTTSRTVHVMHVLGFEGAPRNAKGDLWVAGNTLQFRKAGGVSVHQINISSVQEIKTAEEDRQVGGTPMTLGRAATPFGAGRAIALFSHKKYDTVTINYRDGNEGLHGAIFQLDKGQGRLFKDELIAGGAKVPETPAPSAKPNLGASSGKK